MNQYWVYFMSNERKTVLYVGVTNDLERRVAEHKNGELPGFTARYLCHDLVYFEEYNDINAAIEREKQIKNWGRDKKEWLIATTNPKRIDLSSTWG